MRRLRRYLAITLITVGICWIAQAAWAIYRPVLQSPPKGQPWPHITEFTTGDGKHCVIAIFPAAKFGPPTLAMHCTWARPKIEPAGTNI